jgi:hypothetical protein
VKRNVSWVPYAPSGSNRNRWMDGLDSIEIYDRLIFYERVLLDMDDKILTLN